VRRRQLDRAALRAAAERLDWHDSDIVQQAGERVERVE